MNPVNELIIGVAAILLLPVIAIVVASTIYTNKKCEKRRKHNET